MRNVLYWIVVIAVLVFLSPILLILSLFDEIRESYESYRIYKNTR